MLNRRILRIKAFKTVYALAEKPSSTVSELLSELEADCQATRDLYLFMLAVVPALTAEAKSRIEAAQSKFNPTDEELHPNLKFAGNRIARIISEDPDFQRLIGKKKMSWDQYDVLLRNVYDSIRSKRYFADYMASGISSLAEDAALWKKVFEQEFEDNVQLAQILEDISIWWSDDLSYALSYCVRAMEDFGSGKQWRLPELYLSQMPGCENKESDRDFVRAIVSHAVSGFENDVKAVSELTPKWDKDRICTTDMALIVCGLSEADAFPSTPPRIIINEYVEISKYYSTPESRAFVNGLLNKLLITNR